MIFTLLKQTAIEKCLPCYPEIFPKNSQITFSDLTYRDGKLKIEALHKVKNVNKHYIDKITVKVNGKEVKSMTLDKQSSAASQVVETDLPDLKKGDQIEVTTRCNEFGSKKGNLKL